MNSELKTYILKQSLRSNPEITDDTRIEEDLGIYGDDAVDFLMTYGKLFKVDVTNFMAADYFSGEGIDIVGSIFRSVTGKRKPIKKQLKVLHLEKGINAGKLNEKVINS